MGVVRACGTLECLITLSAVAGCVDSSMGKVKTVFLFSHV